MKKETLEEASERVAYDSTEENKGFPSMKMFIEGAKWQQERMYSEEELKEMIIDAINSCTDGVSSHCQDFEEWFEAVKKK